MFCANLRRKINVIIMYVFLTLRYLDTSVLCIYLLKQKRVIVPDVMSKSSTGKNIYRKDPKFLDRSSGQTLQTEISLLQRNPS